MKTPTIDKILEDLRDCHGFSSYELTCIRIQLLNIAFAVMMDSKVREEVYSSLELKPLDE